MRIKHANLKWIVLRWDYNKKKVVNHDIFTNMAEDIAREVRLGHIYDKSILREYLKTRFIYDYWSKTECECYVSGLFGDECEKIDIWRQIEPNLDKIVDYVNDRMDLKFK